MTAIIETICSIIVEVIFYGIITVLLDFLGDWVNWAFTGFKGGFKNYRGKAVLGENRVSGGVVLAVLIAIPILLFNI